MRFFSFSATLLAAAGAVLAAPQDAGETTIAQTITSATTTYTITRTVERVVQTTYATLPVNGTAPTASPLPPGASLTLTPYGNGTASATGSAASGTAVANQTGIPMMPPNAGASVGSNVAGVAAFAGLVVLLSV
jgi:hypothetical protein